MMTNVMPIAGGHLVDAALLGAAFGIDPAAVPGLLRAGTITGHHAKGMGADAGRQCLTFRFTGRSLQLIIDDQGTILSKSVFTTLLQPGHTRRPAEPPGQSPSNKAVDK